MNAAMLALAVFLWTEVFYLLFLVFAAYHSARTAGRPIPKIALLLIGPPVAFGYLIDVAWNTTLGTVLFLEAPWAESANPFAWTFTGRLKRWKDDDGWRGIEARGWAKLLNPFDPGHV